MVAIEGGVRGDLVAEYPFGVREVAGDRAVVEGIIGGVSGTLIFLPQVLLLFFLISVLEETRYLARAALVADRWLRPGSSPLPDRR